ncbi:hypothetical protein DWB78_15485 [Halopelagius longus]|uniref:Uncharacterized protein n=1 Tax=Halopelagius longus TaxID=1236180 RepID=A0A370IH69_9EURY|nr:hypothetical protein DWB78_15485 [Halopelagius longus]
MSVIRRLDGTAFGTASFSILERSRRLTRGSVGGGDDSLGRYFPTEKAAQLGSVNANELLDEDGTLDESALEEDLSDGIGHLTRIGGEGGLPPNDLRWGRVEETNEGGAVRRPDVLHRDAGHGREVAPRQSVRLRRFSLPLFCRPWTFASPSARTGSVPFRRRRCR